MPEARNVSLREMLAAMAHLPDETVFRWYQDSVVIPDRGWHQPTVTMQVTLGQVRRELAGPPPPMASIADMSLIRDIRESGTWLMVMQLMKVGIHAIADMARNMLLTEEHVLGILNDLDYEGLAVVSEDLTTAELSPRGRRIVDTIEQEEAAA